MTRILARVRALRIPTRHRDRIGYASIVSSWNGRDVVKEYDHSHSRGIARNSLL